MGMTDDQIKIIDLLSSEDKASVMLGLQLRKSLKIDFPMISRNDSKNPDLYEGDDNIFWHIWTDIIVNSLCKDVLFVRKDYCSFYFEEQWFLQLDGLADIPLFNVLKYILNGNIITNKYIYRYPVK